MAEMGKLTLQEKVNTVENQFLELEGNIRQEGKDIKSILIREEFDTLRLGQTRPVGT